MHVSRVSQKVESWSELSTTRVTDQRLAEDMMYTTLMSWQTGYNATTSPTDHTHSQSWLTTFHTRHSQLGTGLCDSQLVILTSRCLSITLVLWSSSRSFTQLSHGDVGGSSGWFDLRANQPIHTASTSYTHINLSTNSDNHVKSLLKKPMLGSECTFKTELGKHETGIISFLTANEISTKYEDPK